MVLELTPEAVFAFADFVDLSDQLLQAGYDTGDPGDVVDQLTRPELWIGAAAGGAFGAALGALPAFCFTGFLVIAGVFGGQGYGVGTGFGPVFGPHISFAAGAAAAAYAAQAGKMESGFDYHNGKDITFALGSRPDIMAVGAAFGVLGLTLEQVSRQLQLPLDPIPLSICISAVIHRAVFGYSIVGKVSDKANGYFDMGPFEREETREPGEVNGDGEKDSEDRLAVEPWLPEMYKWSHVSAIGLVTGGAASFVAFRLVDSGLGVNAAFAGFGISAASLTFLNLGLGRIPATHHMTLPAATAYMATHEDVIANVGGIDPGGLSVGLAPALVIGALFGLLGALIGEVHQRIFYAHSGTHFDPPAASIVVTTLIMGLLTAAEVLSWGVWIPGTT